MENETNQMLRAVLESLAHVHAKLDAMDVRLARFEGETKGTFGELQSQLDYIAQKLGEHDRDLYVLKRRTP